MEDGERRRAFRTREARATSRRAGKDPHAVVRKAARRWQHALH